MYMEQKKAGGGVVCTPFKTMVMHVAFQGKLVGGTEGHVASWFGRFWLCFTLQTVVPWSGTLPWSDDCPWHYRKVADFADGFWRCVAAWWSADQQVYTTTLFWMAGACSTWDQKL